MSPYLVIGVPILVIVFTIGLVNSYDRWTKRRLRQWAKKNQVEIINQGKRWFLRGPFSSIGDHTVFYVTVRDPKGHERNGWVQLGNEFVGLLSSNSKVIWESESGPKG